MIKLSQALMRASGSAGSIARPNASSSSRLFACGAPPKQTLTRTVAVTRILLSRISQGREESVFVLRFGCLSRKFCIKASQQIMGRVPGRIELRRIREAIERFCIITHGLPCFAREYEVFSRAVDPRRFESSIERCLRMSGIEFLFRDGGKRPVVGGIHRSKAELAQSFGVAPKIPKTDPQKISCLEIIARN